HRADREPGATSRRSASLRRSVKECRQGSTEEAQLAAAIHRILSGDITVGHVTVRYGPGEFLSVPAPARARPASAIGKPPQFVIGRALFRGLEVVPCRRHAPDEDRTLAPRVEIGMQPAQQQGEIAPQFGRARLRFRPKYAIAVGVGSKKDLLDKERRGP